MEKIDHVGDHASAFVPNDERSLVDREIPTDETQRWVAETENRISVLETLLASGQDSRAISAEIQSLKLQLSIRTAPAQSMDRIGRIL